MTTSVQKDSSSLLQRSGRLLGGRRGAALADQAVVSAMNVLTMIALARGSSVGEVGLYAACFSLLMFGFAIQAAIVLTPYTMLSPRMKAAEVNRYRGSSVIHQIALGAGFGAAVCIGSLFVTGAGNGALGESLLVLGPVIVVAMSRELARRVCFAELRYREALLVDSLAAVVQLSLILALAAGGGLTARSTLFAVGVGSLAGVAVWLWRSWSRLEFDFPAARRHFSANWGQGRWLLKSSFLWSISVEQYPWLLAAMGDPQQAGVWAACAGLIGFWNPLILSLNNDAGPRIAHAHAQGGRRELSQSVVRAMAWTTLLVAPLPLLVATIGGDILRLIYGPEYASAVTVATILAFSSLVFACGVALPYGLLAMDSPGKDFAANVAAFAVFLGMGIWLTAAYGALGAAVSVLAAQTAAFSVRAVTLWDAVRSPAAESAA